MNDLTTQAARIRYLLNTGSYAGKHEASDIAAVVNTSAAVVRQVRIRAKASKDPRQTAARIDRLESRVRELERLVAALASKRGL